MPNIAVINKSTLVKDADLTTMCAAIDIQCKRDFCPAWGMLPSTVAFYATSAVPNGAWVISVIDDDSSAADALGYHEESNNDTVIGFIMAKPILDNGGQVMVFDRSNPGQYTVSGTLSHECLEMLGDRDCNIYCDDANGVSWCREVCDPVEQIGYGIAVGNIMVSVSDFVLNSFWNPQGTRAANGRINHLDSLQKSFSILPGGYAIQRKGGPGTETQVFGKEMAGWRKAVKQSAFSRGGWRAKVGQKQSAWSRFTKWLGL